MLPGPSLPLIVILCELLSLWAYGPALVSKPLFYFENQGGPAPALVKAEVPWSARRGNLSEKERVLKTVKG